MHRDREITGESTVSGRNFNEKTRYNHKVFTNAESITAKVYLKASPHSFKDGFTFLNIEAVNMDFIVRDINNGVNNMNIDNAIFSKFEGVPSELVFAFLTHLIPLAEAAISIVISSNPYELLKLMKSSIRDELTTMIKKFMDKTVMHIPLEYWLTD